jgi:hypothetical protein
LVGILFSFPCAIVLLLNILVQVNAVGVTGEESTVSDEDLPFEEPKAALPREVRGMANQLACNLFFALKFWLIF